jgi:hypothetical protein
MSNPRLGECSNPAVKWTLSGSCRDIFRSLNCSKESGQIFSSFYNAHCAFSKKPHAARLHGTISCANKSPGFWDFGSLIRTREWGPETMLERALLVGFARTSDPQWSVDPGPEVSVPIASRWDAGRSESESGPGCRLIRVG